MTFLLRAACVIGVIFYFSPVRQADDGMGASPLGRSANPASLHDALVAELLTELLAASGSRTGAAPPSLTAEAERLWRNLSPDAQRALLERVRAAAALPAERPIAASEPGRTDDRHPAPRIPEPPRRP